MSRDFDKLVNKKIGESEISPSNDLWSKIEAELDEKENKKIVVIPFWQNGLFKQLIAASVVFLLGGITATVLFNNDLGNNDLEFAKEQKTNRTIETNKTVNNLKNETHVNLLDKENDSNNLNETDLLAKETGQSTNKNSIKTKRNNYISNEQSSYNHAKTNTNLQSNTIAQVSNANNLSASNYNWIYDEETGAYQVVLKKENDFVHNSFLINNSMNKKQRKTLMAQESLNDKNDSEGKTSMMSLIENEKDEEIETIELNEEEDSYKQFKTKVTKLNYKGFWLGPHVGYESLFAGGEHYAGGIFGVDFGYDFGGSFGLQTGVKYAINTKMIEFYDIEGNPSEYKSEMNSVHVPLMFRYKFTKITQKYSKPLSLNLLAGADYVFTDRKGLHQLGFVAGAEYDIFTQADLMITLGLRGGVYNNLNIARIDVPEKLTPFNYTLSAYIAFRFIDWAKKN